MLCDIVCVVRNAGRVLGDAFFVHGDFSAEFRVFRFYVVADGGDNAVQSFYLGDVYGIGILNSRR